jgi:hypothetical protein
LLRAGALNDLVGALAAANSGKAASSKGSKITAPLVGTIYRAEAAPVASASASAAAAAATATVGADAVQAWYQAGRRVQKQGSSSSSSGSEDGEQSEYAPWMPGQCIDCTLVGGTADLSGRFCGKCKDSSLRLEVIVSLQLRSRSLSRYSALVRADPVVSRRAAE